MSSVNTSFGVQNVPSQVISSTTETALKVPASGMVGYPNPIYASGSGLCVTIPAGAVVDGHPFKVRLAGKVHTGASLTFTPKLYQVPATIIAAGTQATLSNDTAVVTCAASSAINGDANFIVEAWFVWDSASGALNGAVSKASINNVQNAVNSGTAGTSVATSQVTSVTSKDINFLPSFTFGTANAANAVQISEFSILAE